MKKKKKLRKRKNEVFVSPDGGETVYVQNPDGSRGRLVSKSQYAKDIDTDIMPKITGRSTKIARATPKSDPWANVSPR